MPPATKVANPSAIVDRIPAAFAVPATVILNPYWTLVPVPQKALFRDLLFLPPVEPTPVPLPYPTEPLKLDVDYGVVTQASKTLTDAQKKLDKCSNDDKSTLAEKATLTLQLDNAARTLHDAESAHQSQIFNHATQVYAWEQQKDAAHVQVTEHLRRENERKATILVHVQQELEVFKADINDTQRAVMDVEFERAVASEVPYSKIAQVLQMMETSTAIKTDLTQAQTLARNLTRPLKRHLVKTKNK